MFPKTGNMLHADHEELVFASMMSEALFEELDDPSGGKDGNALDRRQLTGAPASRGIHLPNLARNSDEVLRRILIASGRSDAIIALEISLLRTKLIETLGILHKLFPPEPDGDDKDLSKPSRATWKH